MAISITDEEKESLQSVVDRTLSLAERSDCPICPDTEIINKAIKKTPEVMIIHIPRSNANGSKIHTKIYCPTGMVEVKHDKKKIQYVLRGVVTHKGDLSKNGHYKIKEYNIKCAN